MDSIYCAEVTVDIAEVDSEITEVPASVSKSEAAEKHRMPQWSAYPSIDLEAGVPSPEPNLKPSEEDSQYLELLKVLGIDSGHGENGSTTPRIPRTLMKRLMKRYLEEIDEDNKPEEPLVLCVAVGWSSLVVMSLLAMQPILYGSLSHGSFLLNGLIDPEHDEFIDIENAAELAVPEAISAFEKDVSNVHLILQNCNVEVDVFEVKEEQDIKSLEIIIPDGQAKEHNLANRQGEIKREFVKSIVYKTEKGLYKFNPSVNVKLSRGPPMWWTLANLLLTILIIVGTIMGFALGYFIPAALCFLVAMFV